MQRKGWIKGQQIEIYSGNWQGLPRYFLYEADFIFDMNTFQISKNRYGPCDLTPLEACNEFNRLLNETNSRILLLVD